MFPHPLPAAGLLGSIAASVQCHNCRIQEICREARSNSVHLLEGLGLILLGKCIARPGGTESGSYKLCQLLCQMLMRRGNIKVVGFPSSFLNS